MDVVRAGTSNRSPACARRCVDPSQQGFSASRGGGFPVELDHPRPRLGRAREALARRSWTRCAQAGARDRRGQRLPGRHARGARDPRPQQGRRPRHQHGATSARPSTPPSAACARASSRTAAAATTSACACWPSSASGRRTSSACSCAPAAGDLVRLGDLVRIEQQPTLQAITRKDRERAITIFANVAPGASQAEALDRPRATSRASVLPDGYRAVPSGTSQAFQESLRVAGVRVRAWA